MCYFQNNYTDPKWKNLEFQMFPERIKRHCLKKYFLNNVDG